MTADVSSIQSRVGVLENLRVRTKILLGFASVLVVLISALAFAYFSFVRVSHDVDEYAIHVEEAGLIAKIEVEFLRFTSHAREFANTGHAEDAEKVFQTATIIRPLLDKALNSFASDAHRARVEEISTTLERYLKDFEKIKILSDEYHALIVERLEPDGIKVVADLNALIARAESSGNIEVLKKAVAAREHALLARLYANILIGRQDDSFGEKAASEFGMLEKGLLDLGPFMSSQEDKLVLNDAMTLFEDYRSAFDKIRADELTIVDTVNGDMKTAADLIIRDTEELTAEIAAVEHSIFERVIDEIGLAEMEILIASVIGMVLGIAVAVLIGDRLSKPIIAITALMRKLADHDLTVVIPWQSRKDEIGQMAGAVQVFKDNAIRNDELEAKAIEDEKRAKEVQRAFMNTTADTFNADVGQIIETVAAAAVELQATADAMSRLASSASEQTITVASATEQASGNVHSVASATEELNTSIEEINRQVVHSSEVARNAVGQVRQTQSDMKELVDASEGIATVLKMISEIADQTNMLALNATIEAARAGEAGRGFAVVANEVKNLSDQTTKATEEIARYVDNLQSRTGSAVNQIEAIGKTVGEMDGIIATISSAIEEQSAATREIAFNVEQAATGTTVVSSNIATVSSAVNEAGSASSDVLRAVSMLSQNFTTLKGATDHFVDTIRTA
ncbi:MAG: methyl-accepting chemotaxis protein [Thalassospira sp.]|uniref:methyl-accepting chemotaxis protein n=1 Tax=Thalassospira sp. TaxID=1912094 RepID=UPI0032ECF628